MKAAAVVSSATTEISVRGLNSHLRTDRQLLDAVE